LFENYFIKNKNNCYKNKMPYINYQTTSCIADYEVLTGTIICNPAPQDDHNQKTKNHLKPDRHGNKHQLPERSNRSYVDGLSLLRHPDIPFVTDNLIFSKKID